MKSLATFLALAALSAASAFAQMNQPILGDNPVKISDHVWAIMGFPNVAIVVGYRLDSRLVPIAITECLGDLA